MLNSKNIKLIMFDLDGTLVDSVPDLAFAVDAMLTKLGQPKASMEQVRLWVGNGAQMLVKRALSQCMLPKEIEGSYLDKAMALFFEYYEKVNGSKSQLYPQVLETLNKLRKEIPFLVLITNKPEQFTRPLLDHHSLPKFDLVVCGDTLKRKKPAPDQLLYCLEKLGCNAEESIMVGDSVSDIKAAQAANIPVVCVSYGYNQGQDLSAYKPDLIIHNIESLMKN